MKLVLRNYFASGHFALICSGIYIPRPWNAAATALSATESPSMSDNG
jgi:hypothetical protein